MKTVPTPAKRGKKIPRAPKADTRLARRDRFTRPRVTIKFAVDPAVKRAFLKYAKKSTYVSAGYIAECLMALMLTDRNPNLLIHAGAYDPTVPSRERRAESVRRRVFYDSMASPDEKRREAAAAELRPPAVPTRPKLDVNYAFRNVLRFVRDVRALQERAWLFSVEMPEVDRLLVQPFEGIVKTAMGEIASRYVSRPDECSTSIDEIECTELLAGLKKRVPWSGGR